MKPTKTRTRKRTVAGRTDVLLARLLEEAVRVKANPILSAVHSEFAPVIEKQLAQYVGPRTKRGRMIKRYLETGAAILAKAQAARLGNGTTGGQQ